MTVCRHTNNYTLDPWSVSISCLEMDVRQQPEGANASWKKFRWCTRPYQRVVFPQSCRRLALIASWSCPSARLSTARWTPAPLGKIVSSMIFGQPHSGLRVWKLSYIYRRQAFRQSNYYIILFRPYYQFHHRHLWFLSDIWSCLFCHTWRHQEVKQKSHDDAVLMS